MEKIIAFLQLEMKISAFIHFEAQSQNIWLVLIRYLKAVKNIIYQLIIEAK